MNNDHHVYPVGDLKEHNLTRDCWCRPAVDTDLEMVIHNSMDGREQYETGERRPH